MHSFDALLDVARDQQPLDVWSDRTTLAIDRLHDDAGFCVSHRGDDLHATGPISRWIAAVAQSGVCRSPVAAAACLLALVRHAYAECDPAHFDEAATALRLAAVAAPAIAMRQKRQFERAHRDIRQVKSLLVCRLPACVSVFTGVNLTLAEALSCLLDGLDGLDDVSESSAEKVENASAGAVLWLTGVSGVGKTSLALEIVAQLPADLQRRCLHLDGDMLRASVWKGSHGDEYSLSRRHSLATTYSHVAKSLSARGFIVICSTISLFHFVHELNRRSNTRYLEVLLRADVQTLRQRDSKGLYHLATQAHEAPVVGVNLIAEFPRAAHIEIDTSDGVHSIEVHAGMIIAAMRESLWF